MATLVLTVVGSLVAGVHPAAGVDGLGGALRVFPVA